MLLLKKDSLVVNYDVRFKNSEVVRKKVNGQIERLLETPQFLHIEETPIFGEQVSPVLNSSKKDIDSPLVTKKISNELKLFIAETMKVCSYQTIRTTKINYATPFTLAFLFSKSIVGWERPTLNSQQESYYLMNAGIVDTNDLSLLLRNKETELCLEELRCLSDTKPGDAYDVYEHLLENALPDIAEFIKAFKNAGFYNSYDFTEPNDNERTLARSNTEVIKKLGLKPTFVKK